MVELGAASAREDTALVELEARLVGLDGDRDRLLLDGSLKLRLGVGLDIGVARDLDSSWRGLGGRASASLASVGVGRLENIALGLDVLEAVVHEATVAALVSIAARARH